LRRSCKTKSTNVTPNGNNAYDIGMSTGSRGAVYHVF
jgi:hypothetical protein